MSEANRGIKRLVFLTKTSGLSLALVFPVSNRLSVQQLPSDITHMGATQLKGIDY